MKFAPKPENEFYEFIRTYYRECRGRFPKIEAIAGKWMYRDLVPGLSDFDTRFITSDGVTDDEWSQMSTAVGQVHLDLCLQHPCWCRFLEHLPGINLTWRELLAEESYYPEFKQWTFYDTTEPGKVSAAQAHFAAREWDLKDEYFHLKRFCTYYGSYNRTIDPPINLGVQENKYPLHSRIMHYFSPPVHSAVCLIDRKNMPGKMNAFELAHDYFPGLRCWELVDEILGKSYALPEWYAEERLSELEDVMEEALGVIAHRLRQGLALPPEKEGGDIAALKRRLGQISVDPILQVFESCRFSRLMKGRLWFYLNAPAYFDSSGLIHIELNRLGNSFFKVPFQRYWKIRSGETVADPTTILDQLRGDPLSDEDIQATREFARWTFSDWRGRERQVVEQIIVVYDGFYKALSKITASLKAIPIK